jgi:hypothetical protein
MHFVGLARNTSQESNMYYMEQNGADFNRPLPLLYERVGVLSGQRYDFAGGADLH